MPAHEFMRPKPRLADSEGFTNPSVPTASPSVFTPEYACFNRLPESKGA